MVNYNYWISGTILCLWRRLTLRNFPNNTIAVNHDSPARYRPASDE
jgi:hypothetical protein